MDVIAIVVLILFLIIIFCQKNCRNEKIKCAKHNCPLEVRKETVAIANKSAGYKGRAKKWQEPSCLTVNEMLKDNEVDYFYYCPACAAEESENKFPT